MADPDHKIKATHYHRTLELHIGCGADVLRNLVQKKLELSGLSLIDHLNQPPVRKAITELCPKFLKTDQLALLYPNPQLKEMDVTLLSCLLLNGKFIMSVDEIDKVKRLRKERNALSHVPKPELEDDISFNRGSHIIVAIAYAVGKDFGTKMKTTVTEIQKKELVTCHSNHEVILIRGEAYMVKLIEMPGTVESIDSSNTTYLRFSLIKWAKRFVRSVDIDNFLTSLKGESILSATEIGTIQHHYSKGEQFNDLILKMVDKTDKCLLKFLKCLRFFNPYLADLIENKDDDGNTTDGMVEAIEKKSIKSALEMVTAMDSDGEIKFEELQIAIEEILDDDVNFSDIELILIKEFGLKTLKDEDFSFKGISLTDRGKEILQGSSLFTNNTDMSMESIVEDQHLLDLTSDQFADYVSSKVNTIKDGYGPMVKEALITECISPSCFASLTKEDIEDTFIRYLKGHRLIMGVQKQIQSIQQELQGIIEARKKKQVNSEMIDALRPFDRSSERTNYRNGKVGFTTGNLLVPIHEFKTLPSAETDTTAFIVKETVKFISACMNSRRNGTIHFGIEACGLSNGVINGLKLTTKNARQRMDSYLIRGIGVCFRAGDIQYVKRCIRPFQLVEAVSTSFVLEMDVVPSVSCTNSSFFPINFPPKGRQKLRFFVFNEETPCELVSVPKVQVKGAIETYRNNVKMRERLENISEGYNLAIEKLRARLTAGSEYCTEQYIPMFCFGKLTDVDKESYIRDQITVHLTDAFLSSLVVFDFDASTAQRKAAEKDNSLQFMVKITDVVVNPSECDADRYWIYCNGNSDLNIPVLSENEWYKTRFSILRDSMTEFRKQIPKQRALLICLLFDEPACRDPMVEFIEDCMNFHFRNECVVITDSEEKIRGLKRNVCQRITAGENAERHFFSGNSWQDIAQLIRSVFQSPKRSDIQLPCSDGKEVFLSKQQHLDMKLTDIEILSGKLCQDEEQMDDDQRRKLELQEKETFYKGGDVSWWNFHYNSHVGERNVYRTYLSSIREKLTQESEKLTETKIIRHQPGAGGSTAGKYLLWHLSQFKYLGILKSYRCCIIKAITENTADEIYDFLSFEEPNPKPVVALIDNASDERIGMLKELLNEKAYKKLNSQSNLFCLLIIIKRVPASYNRPSEQVLGHQLTKAEETWFENKYKELEENEAIDVRTLISFNVMRKGFDKRYINELADTFLNDVTDTEMDILKCLALINSFDRDNAIPVSVFDYLQYGSQDNPYKQNLAAYLRKGPRGLVVPMARKFRQDTDLVWERTMSESFSLLIKRTHGSATRSSAGSLCQHTGVMIISQALAKAVLDNILSRQHMDLADAIDYVLEITKEHVKERNPLSKEFVRIVNSLFKTRQFLSDKGDTKAKFSDMVIELKNKDPSDASDGCNTVIRLMKLCFDITQDVMVGQQLSRFYIDMKRYTEAETMIQQSIDLQPKSSYLLDTFGQVFYSKMVYQIAQMSQEPRSVCDETASEIICTALEAIKKFCLAQKVTFEVEGEDNNNCFFMVVKTTLDLLETFYKFSCQNSEDNLLAFLNDPDISVVDTQYRSLATNCPIDEFKVGMATQRHVEESLRMLEERQYQLKYNFYTIHTAKGESLLLDLRERYERFYGNENVRKDYKFRYGVGLKSIMTVNEKDEHALQKRVDDAIIKVNRRERVDKLKGVDRRDLLILLGDAIIQMSVKGAQEEAVEPIALENYNRLLRYAAKLLELEKKAHRPHLEAYLYFTILNWPSNTRHDVVDLCKPESLKNTLREWEKTFNDNFRQDPSVRKRSFPKTYFALGNRGLGCDIVDFSKVENMWRSKRNIRRNYVKDDQVLKEPFVTDVLNRFEGTLNHNGTVAYYEIKRQFWEYSLEISAYTPCKELSNRRVTFILVFTWAGPKANDIQEYVDAAAAKSGEPVSADKRNITDTDKPSPRYDEPKHEAVVDAAAAKSGEPVSADKRDITDVDTDKPSPRYDEPKHEAVEAAAAVDTTTHAQPKKEKKARGRKKKSRKK